MKKSFKKKSVKNSFMNSSSRQANNINDSFIANVNRSMKLKSRIILVLSLGMIFVAWAASAWAEGPAVPAGSSGSAPAAHSAPQQSGLMAFAPFILMFAVLYLLILRPQQKKMKDQQQMLSSLKHGDEVITNSGILGKITGITDKVVTVEVADNVRVKMMKSQISQVIKGSIKDIAQGQ